MRVIAFAISKNSRTLVFSFSPLITSVIHSSWPQSTMKVQPALTDDNSRSTFLEISPKVEASTRNLAPLSLYLNKQPSELPPASTGGANNPQFSKTCSTPSSPCSSTFVSGLKKAVEAKISSGSCPFFKINVGGWCCVQDFPIGPLRPSPSLSSATLCEALKSNPSLGMATIAPAGSFVLDPGASIFFTWFFPMSTCTDQSLPFPLPLLMKGESLGMISNPLAISPTSFLTVSSGSTSETIQSLQISGTGFFVIAS
mmetsp:Transcript_1910/g.3468  ORF Transcript_1910/g.3468 Transcript_1910/m.3468 type:complete len:256 (-) Transcript_1910:373-1140(-)